MTTRLRFVAVLALAPGCYSGAGGNTGTDGATDSGPTAPTSPDSTTGGETGGGTEGMDESGGESGDPPAECEGEILDPGPNLVRRLTVTEYGNTVDALLQVDVRAEAVSTLPAELRADGFSNTASGLISTLGHVEGYDELAELAVSRIPDLPGFAAGYADCVEFQDNCKRSFVEQLGRRAFRRPLTVAESDALVGVFDVAEDEGDGFDVGAGLVIEAMMQSPPFLFRLEDETTGSVSRTLGGYDMASRLSYLLWSGPPDDALLDAAGADALATDEELVAQVERMLGEETAKNASLVFVGDWLNLARLDFVTRDPVQFPSWSVNLGSAMREETNAFFNSVVWDQDRPLVELYNAQEAWLTPELATHYGLEPAGEGAMLYDVSALPQRGGLLTQGALLTLGGDEASMVARGLFVLESLICGELGSPPPGVNTEPPALEPGKSQRFYSEERTTNPTCLGCHIQMEPFAWGIEQYLADGTHATQDAYGNELYEDGYVVFPGDPENYDFANSAEMMETIANHPKTGECLGLKGVQFAMGRRPADSDDCSIDQLQQHLVESDGTWRDLMVAITLSPGFRHIRVEE